MRYSDGNCHTSNVVKITKSLVLQVTVVPCLGIEVGRAGTGIKIIN
jgi:hypothetical protein